MLEGLKGVFIVFMIFATLVCIFAVLVLLRDIIKEAREERKVKAEGKNAVEIDDDDTDDDEADDDKE